jgi:hypothetical protein
VQEEFFSEVQRAFDRLWTLTEEAWQEIRDLEEDDGGESNTTTDPNGD